jgi:voltage-gated potassium channel
MREAVDRLLHDRRTELFVLVLILASVLLTLVEVATHPPHPTIVLVNDAITWMFVVELCLRFWIARKKSRFFRRYWIDIIAVLPVVRPLRLFRVLRVLRLFRAGVLLNRRVSAFRGGAVGRTGSELMALGLGTLVLVLAAAMVLHAAERSVNPEFAEFGDAMWFSALSLIGGEPIGAEPRTELGRWTTLLVMLGGLSVFGMFVGTVSAGMVSRLSKRLEVHELDIDELRDHVLVCGWNRSGGTMLRELFAGGLPPGRGVVLVTEAPDYPTDIPDDGIDMGQLYHVHGDYTQVDVLEKIGVRHASSVVLLTDEVVARSPQDRDARTVLAALTIERMAPEIYTVAELHSRQNEELLRMAGVEEIVVGDWYAGMILGSVARNRGLVSVLDEILTGRHGNAFHTVAVPDAWVGRTVADLHTELFVERRAVLISVERPDHEVVVNPDPELVLRVHDRLVVLCHDPASLS